MKLRTSREKPRARRRDSRGVDGVAQPGSPLTKPSLWARRRLRRAAGKQKRAQARTGRGWSR